MGERLRAFPRYRELIMPLTKKGGKILASMREYYGKKRGKRVFYASQQKGTVKGTHRKRAT